MLSSETRTAIPLARPLPLSFTDPMERTRTASVLRLAHADDAPRPPVLSRLGAPARDRRARRSVASENLAAAGLSPSDARWMLAIKVSQRLDGGNLALLTPERRREIVSLATRIGLRQFDANLVIAIVQDGARSGEGVLSPGVAGRIGMVGGPSLGARKPETAERAWRRSWMWMLVAAALFGAVIWGALVRWLAG
jgi:hypothetical protein